jgi:hypothetical protein
MGHSDQWRDNADRGKNRGKNKREKSGSENQVPSSEQGLGDLRGIIRAVGASGHKRDESRQVLMLCIIL